MVANLRQLRTKKGVSQQRLADALGITQQAINKYENHAVEPDIYMLMKLADYFETTVDYLIGRTEQPWKSTIGANYVLSSDEATIIEEYRVLSSEERESIRMIMKNYMRK